MTRFYLIAMLFLVACSQSSGGSDAKDGHQSDVAHGRGEILLPDVPSGDVADARDIPLFDLVPVDLQVVDVEPGCQAGAGCFLDPCESGEDCLSGLCVGHLGNDVCTMECVEECPQGWFCEQLGSGPDTMFACVSPFTHLCRPCATSADCVSPSGIEDVCLIFGDSGSFCGAACQATSDCPAGFECLGATTTEGGQVSNCKPVGGEVCPCSSQSVKLGLTTPCQVTNDVGSCPGLRMCQAAGLSECDAPVPAQESCDGLDNDCNGQVDDLDCADDNDCTQDTCDPAVGCLHTPLTGTECADGNVCTLADHCQEGACVGTAIDCDDNDPCTQDSCDPTGGCSYGFNTAPCDDGNPCTVEDMCNSGECQGEPLSCQCQTGSDCGALEDGNLCNGTLRCNTDVVPYLCEVNPDTVVTCPPYEGADAQCLANECQPTTGKCDVVAANEGMACDDGDACTLGDRCVAGVCTGDVATSCDDQNPCTDDSCDPQTGCVHSANTAPCDDGNLCTLNDVCAAGMCQGGPALFCNDDNPCTDDGCLPDTGCVATPNAAPCDDADFCTQGDVCTNGACQPGPVIDCSDNTPCTDDSCDPGLGCVHTANAAPCDDGNPCTLEDVCTAGSCQGGSLKLCADENPCTDDSCDPDQGCLHVPNQVPCDDGDLCTQGDTCAAGTCLSGPATNCDDGNICTDDTCQPEVGCIHSLNNAPCSDDDVCTINDHCHLGACIGGAPLLCADNDPCTEDGCLPGEGCVFTAIAGCCPAGLTDCAGICQDLVNDPVNCGECGKSCAPVDNGDVACQESQCVIAACEEYFDDCDQDYESGCEANLLTDSLNCQNCGDMCAVDEGENCLDGQCLCIPACQGKDCGDDGCGGVCGECQGGEDCLDGVCTSLEVGSFKVLEQKSVLADGIHYLLLKVALSSTTATTDNWCFEYEHLCQHFGLVPTGCGNNFDSGGYKECKTNYSSNGQSNTLGCNPSGGIASVVKANGYPDATSSNSFGFHYCGTACEKELCSGSNCNSALSYLDATNEVAYTLCFECASQCEGKVCGDDGCGGTCGQCPGPQDACLDGQCVCQPACEGLLCGDDGCGGSCGGCDGKECGDDGCGGLCGTCQGNQEECVNGTCTCIPACDGKTCGDDGCGGLCGLCNVPGTVCHLGQCQPFKDSWVILDEKEIVYKGIYYLLVKVGLKSTTATSANWCQEYTNLCQSYGYLPTGCGDQFPSGGYGVCKSTYLSDGTSNTLGCNPSGGIANAAQQNGYNDANSANSFGFHSCGGSCQKELCSGDHCNSAISYIDATKDFGYTLCLMCKPDCAGKNCGDDGCGGSCGSCQGNQDACVAGTCTCQPACDGLLCGDDGCGGSCGGCDGKVCGDDGCGGTCGTCPGLQEECIAGACVCIPDCVDKVCGDDGCGGSCGTCDNPDEGCHVGQCKPYKGSWIILDEKEIVYKGLYYLLLQVGFKSDLSTSDNWCYEYTDLCQSYGYLPTGCGDQFPSGGYGVCKSTYKSDGTSNTLGCNPSGGIANAAQQNGYNDANSANSFGFHSCGGSCQKQMCSGDHCNSALSYIDMTKDHGYTLCLKCKPDCTGKVCGDDGCGGTCGSCLGQQESCVDGLCVCQPACDGLLCGDDGCGGSCGGCEGKVCGDDGCGGTCGTCGNPQEECQNGACVCVPDCAGKVCGEDGCGGSCGACQGQGESCWTGQCKPAVGSFAILEAKDITYKDIPYLLLKVGLISQQSTSDNWCYEYLNLCQSFGPEGYLPTGCGDQFPSGGYGVCKSTYQSNGISNSLGCNPSGGIANAAQQNGFGDATSTNSFGFHSCGGSCQKTMCTGDHCNSALSYIDMNQPYGYTLCIK